MSEMIIQVNGLCKSYGTKQVIKDLSFQVEEGMVFGLLGANGAGKSTTIDCILGTKKSDAGEISIFGKNPKKERRKLFEMVGVQFQEGDYQNEIRVGELCEETACLYKHTADWRALLKRFGIEGKEKQAVKNLSGGERQRLFIVLALIPEPKMVFLDELTTGLDAKARRSVWKILEELKERGLTILLTSHFMDEAEALCDKICILKNGDSVFQGTVEEAMRQSESDTFEDAYLKFSDEEVEWE